jgi:hypothetical protein
MPNRPGSARLARLAFFAALAAQVVACCYALSLIARPAVYRGPLIAEFRYLVLALGLLGIFLGALALIRKTGSKPTAIAAIALGLLVVTWHVLLCGTDALENARYCMLTWGVIYP